MASHRLGTAHFAIANLATWALNDGTREHDLFPANDAQSLFEPVDVDTVRAGSALFDGHLSVPNRIRELRKGRGWTQEKLAHLVDTHHTTIQRLESGTRQLSERWVRALARAFHCHPGELFESLPRSSQSEQPGELDRQELRSYRIAREILESMNRHGLEDLSEVEVHTYAEAISRALFHPEMADDRRRRQFVESKLFDIRQYKKLRGQGG